MKLLVELSKKRDEYNIGDGIILPLKDYSMESGNYYSLDEVRDISLKYRGEVFVKMNRNLMNSDIDKVRDILIKLDSMNISGVFFYDLAILELKKELNLKLDLVWNQTHMVNNYNTCNYYYSKGVKYALLGKEITLEEIDEILNKSSIISMVEVVSRPSIAVSRRSLLTNYYKNNGGKYNNKLDVVETVTGESIRIEENKYGTNFYLDKIVNGTSIIQNLYNNGCSYIIMREYGIDNFDSLVNDTIKYISNGCIDKGYVDKYKVLGDYTNFFFKKTIYKVK